MQPIFRSLLETDLYKFTMWQAMLHRHPQTQAEYTFVCRNQSAYPLSELLAQVNQQLDHLCTLGFAADELAYLRGLRFMKSDFVDFLRIFRFQREFINVRANGNNLDIVARGPQVHVMAFEIFVLAIVNELYFRRFDEVGALKQGRQRLRAKIEQLQSLRRRARAAPPLRVFRLRRAPQVLRGLAARSRIDLEARRAAILQGHVERAARARSRPGADRHDGA